MSTFYGRPYSTPKNITLSQGLLRFGAKHASNPFGDATYGLYVDDSTGKLIFRSLTTSYTLDGGGGGGTPSWDSIIAGDQTMQMGALPTWTIDRNSGNNDILTITNTGAGSGDLIQITNVGTGKDINGTSGTWSFSKVGDLVANKVTFAGDAGSDSITLTAGDVSIADGSLTIVDADNATSLSVTNATATSSTVIAFIGGGTFTGNTTSSFMTVTATGLTTGTVMYIPVASLTTGKAINIVGTTALTTGILVNIESGTTGTSLTGAGRLLYVNHTGTGTSTGILSEFTSAAADETVILKVTASGALASGSILSISGSSMTTGNGIKMSDLDSLTTGIGLDIESAATAITGVGRLLYVNHTGATSTSGILSEFASDATDETVVVKISTAEMVSGIALNIVGTTGMTTGSLIRATTSTAEAVATNGIYSFKSTGAFSSTSNAGLVDIGASATTEGTLVHIASSAAGQTATSLLYVEASGFTTGYTGDVATFKSSSTTGDSSVVAISAANTTDGTALKVTSAATTTNGKAIEIIADALTTGVGVLFAHKTSVIADGGSMLRLSDSGVATGGTTNGYMLDIQNTGSTAGTMVKIYSNVAGQTATCLLDIAASGYTTGYTGSIVKITGVSTTGDSNVLLVTGANTTAGNTVKIDAAGLTTGTGLLVTSAGTIVTTGELVSLIANSATTSTGILRLSATSLTDGWCAEFTGGGANFTASGGMLSLAMGAATVGTGLQVVSTGIYTGETGLLALTANSATTGVIAAISATGLTTGAALKITTNTTATGEYINCYDGAAVDFKVSRYGAVTIAGNAAGTAALTLSAGDIVTLGGNLNISNKVIFSGIETIAGGGTTTAADITKTLHSVDADAGGDIITLEDGTIGQVMFFACPSATGTVTITPANLAGGTSVTLNAEGDTVILMFVDTQWYIMGGNGYSVV